MLAGTLVTALVYMSPIVQIFVLMYKGARDVERAHEELKRTVNPDEFRSWVLSLIKEHPEGAFLKETEAGWPETFPRFAGSRRLHVHLHPSYENQRALKTLVASVVWGFSGGCGLQVTVMLNPDGTPCGDDDIPPWDRGIMFSHLHR